MHQIRISSLENPTIYRTIKVPSMMSIFDLDMVVTTSFTIDVVDGMEKVFFESVRLNGKKRSKIVFVYNKNFSEVNGFDETVDEWFIQIGDEVHYTAASGIKLKLTLDNVSEMDELEACILDGQGDLFSNRKKINVNKLNKTLQLDQELEEHLFEENLNSFSEFLVPDYSTLFMLADELKKLKPWNYFNNDDIIALQVDDMKYFISVMGAGGQEYGLMMYDEALGYQSLEKVINGEPLSEDFAIGMSALTVNYVDRDKLKKEDYELIKEQGLSFRGKKNWIVFRMFEPGLVAVHPDYEEVEDMIHLINMMIEITQMRMSGWVYPDVPSNSFPLFEVKENEQVDMLGIIQLERIEDWILEIEVNDLEVAKVKKKPKSPLEIELDYYYIKKVFVERDMRPMYPLIELIMDHATGEIIRHEIVPFPKHSFIQQQLFWQTLNELTVRPSKIFVTEDTYRILSPVANLVGLKLIVSALPRVDEFKKY